MTHERQAPDQVLRFYLTFRGQLDRLAETFSFQQVGFNAETPTRYTHQVLRRTFQDFQRLECETGELPVIVETRQPPEEQLVRLGVVNMIREDIKMNGSDVHAAVLIDIDVSGTDTLRTSKLQPADIFDALALVRHKPEEITEVPLFLPGVKLPDGKVPYLKRAFDQVILDATAPGKPLPPHARLLFSMR